MPLIDLNGLAHFKDKENAMVADDYSATSTYSVGDYVYYNGTLYRCTTAISTAEAWTAGHWTAAKIADEIGDLKSAFYNYNNIIHFAKYNGISTSGVSVKQSGNFVTLNGVYTASARRRFNLSGNLENIATAAPSSWYSTKIGEFKAGKTYRLRSDILGGSISSELTGYAFNIQILNTAGTLISQNYFYTNNTKSESIITPESDINVGAVVLVVQKDYTFNDFVISLYLEEINPTVAYVDGLNGSDLNDGSIAFPLKTITKAIMGGAEEIIAKAGAYNEKISIDGKRFTLKKWLIDEDYSNTVPFRPKIEIINGTKLTVSESGTTNIYQAPFSADADSNIYKVFITRELAPTTQGTLSIEYNALFIGDKPNTITGNNRQRLYTPVLTETELSAQGTFYYNGTNILFHPWNNTLDDNYYVPLDTADTLINITNAESVNISDVRVIGAYNNCIYIEHCNNVKIESSEIGLCAKGMGLAVFNSNIEVTDCHAFGCSVDGFNIHEYGYSKFCNCTSFYNGDDGISHHQGCTGIIIGGEYAFNASGGITPAYGALIEVQDSYSHDNGFGLQVLGQSGMRRYIKAANLLLLNNTTDVYVTYNDLLIWNSIYTTKQTASYGYITEYNNQTPT